MQGVQAFATMIGTISDTLLVNAQISYASKVREFLLRIELQTIVETKASSLGD
jgi:hypothetical protein